MKIRTLILLLVLILIAVFAALNWDALTVPTALSLGVTTVEAPLGLVMLGLLIAVTVVFLGFLLYLQTSVLVEARRHARELQAHRGLADQAEASRFTELRRYIEGEFQTLAARDAETREAMLARLDQLDDATRTSLEESGNTLAAYLGELEDRLERAPAQARAFLPARRDE